MDGGEKEKTVANGIKEIVKHTSRRKVVPQTKRPANEVIKLAPKPSSNSLEDSSTNSGSTNTATLTDQGNKSTVSLVFFRVI